MSLTCIDATQVNENTTVATDFQNEALDSESADFSSLSDDINNCSETKLFKLTRNYTYDSQNDAEYVNGINITIDDLTIDGQGHTINAKKEAKIFNIRSKNVVLRNIIIINAFANSNGGAIYWEGSNGTLSNSIIKDSYCPKIGGGVYFCKAAIIENTRFINNYAYFGGAVDLEAESTLTNCEFEGNYAKYLGGGIFSSENAYILNSNFTENEAGDGGGAYFEWKGSIDNCLFSENIAIGYGGAITSEGDATIRNSTFLKNTGKYAGAIFYKGTGKIINNQFRENIADFGGAIMASGYSVEICSDEFILNTAKQGSSLYIDAKNAKIANLTFSNRNSSIELEIYLETPNPSLDNLSFSNTTNKSENNESVNDSSATSNNNTNVNPSNASLTIANPAISSNSNPVKENSKRKTKIIAKSKTFKSSAKIKKYYIKLKSGKGTVKNRKVSLKINGKTYISKTNKYGKALFKIRLTKKGKFKALIKFKGDKTYKASQKIIKIKVK